jgi:DNA anti-recombination protein RmuC
VKNANEGELATVRERLQAQQTRLNRRLEQLKLQTIGSREAFMQAVEERLSQMEQEINALEQQAESASGQMQSNYNEEANQLRARYNTLTQTLNQAQEASQEEFANMRDTWAKNIAELHMDIEQKMDEMERESGSNQ